MGNPATHIPFPWEQMGSYIVHKGDDCGAVALLAEPEARTSDDMKSIDIGSPNWDVAMANGKLIVAIPKMVEIVRDLVHLMDGAPKDDVEKLDFIAKRIDEIRDRARTVLNDIGGKGTK